MFIYIFNIPRVSCTSTSLTLLFPSVSGVVPEQESQMATPGESGEHKTDGLAANPVIPRDLTVRFVTSTRPLADPAHHSDGRRQPAALSDDAVPRHQPRSDITGYDVIPGVSGLHYERVPNTSGTRTELSSGRVQLGSGQATGCRAAVQ